ncbi:hypothetical protein HanXRQr2_Chr04g0179241 [Helianthus annuus]|uniref:Uncharacterized protein n=1 Tax=Helianthus annuus TaxID=4232 RepID=A0A9K3J9H7_HELAN|nr:hypothetical protein HanXRQr2_Chr04g0179231 [Helianthus annuus]KAF5811246.1 hypothetical protein HanXRQr2_Chr04g0179241 [Helianthus annuus]
METLVHNFRLDAQEQRIKQLQGDVAEIKTTLKALEEHHAESREFRKVFLAWIQHQETRSDDSLSGSGSPSFFPNLSSDLQLDCVVDRHSDSLPNPPPSLLEQLESIIARSEERLGKSRLHNGCGSKSRPDSVNWALSPAENAFVHDQFEEVSDNHGNPRMNIHSVSTFSGGSADPLIQSPSSLPNSPSILAPGKAMLSRSEENSIGLGCLLSHSSNGVMTSDLEGILGSGTVAGHGEEQKLIVGPDSPDLGLLCEKTPPARFGSNMAGLQWNSKSLVGGPTQSAGRLGSSEDFLLTVLLFQRPPPLEKQLLMAMVVSTFKIGDKRLGWKGGTIRLFFCPYVTLHNSVIELLVDSYHFWVVHGQGRPPDVVADHSLEDKTVLKGGVMMGICYEREL